MATRIETVKSIIESSQDLNELQTILVMAGTRIYEIKGALFRNISLSASITKVTSQTKIFDVIFVDIPRERFEEEKEGVLNVTVPHPDGDTEKAADEFFNKYTSGKKE